jgi:hypothetical protein
LQDKWDGLRDLVQNMASTTKVSNQPAIYGQLAAADVMRLKGQVQPGLTTGAAESKFGFFWLCRTLGECMLLHVLLCVSHIASCSAAKLVLQSRKSRCFGAFLAASMYPGAHA